MPKPSKFMVDHHGDVRYEYIGFHRQPAPKRKTQIWDCYNIRNGSKLGQVEYYPAWRSYCFTHEGPEVILSPGCLADIQDFLSRLPWPDPDMDVQTH